MVNLIFRHAFANYFKQMEDIEEYRVSKFFGHKGSKTNIYDRYEEG